MLEDEMQRIMGGAQIKPTGKVTHKGDLPVPAGSTRIVSAEGTPVPTDVSKFALSELVDDWHFFNHGALFTYCGMEYPKNDPVADWYAAQPIGTEIIQQPFKTLLFDGLNSPIHVGPLTWGHVICACRHEYWDSLKSFLDGVATVDHRKKLYAQTFTGTVDMLDPVLVERFSILKPDIARISVTVFCADTNKGRWEIRPAKAQGGRPHFVERPARPPVVEMGHAVIAGDIGRLKHKDNPDYQSMLDKFKSLRGL